MDAPTLTDVCDFLLANAPGLKGATQAGALPWVNWYWRDGRVGVVREAGKVVAVALARCVDDVADAEAKPYFHNEAGRFVWVQDIVSLHPEGVPLLLGHAVQRFGPREAFAGRVFNRAGELRMLPWKTVERLARGGVNHGFSQSSGTAGTAGLQR